MQVRVCLEFRISCVRLRDFRFPKPRNLLASMKLGQRPSRGRIRRSDASIRERVSLDFWVRL